MCNFAILLTKVGIWIGSLLGLYRSVANCGNLFCSRISQGGSTSGNCSLFELTSVSAAIGKSYEVI